MHAHETQLCVNCQKLRGTQATNFQLPTWMNLEHSDAFSNLNVPQHNENHLKTWHDREPCYSFPTGINMFLFMGDHRLPVHLSNHMMT